MPEIEYLIVEYLSTKQLRRIFSKITVNPNTRCWEWRAETTRQGYGRIKFNARRELIHRLLYAWTVEPLRRGYGGGIPELDHIVCNNRGCANPAHVILTSHRSNALRSSGPTAENARKTHCKRGHLLPKEPNDARKKKRYCKICLSEWGKVYHKKPERRRRARELYRQKREEALSNE